MGVDPDTEQRAPDARTFVAINGHCCSICIERFVLGRNWRPARGSIVRMRERRPRDRDRHITRPHHEANAVTRAAAEAHASARALLALLRHSDCSPRTLDEPDSARPSEEGAAAGATVGNSTTLGVLKPASGPASRIH